MSLHVGKVVRQVIRQCLNSLSAGRAAGADWCHETLSVRKRHRSPGTIWQQPLSVAPNCTLPPDVMRTFKNWPWLSMSNNAARTASGLSDLICQDDRTGASGSPCPQPKTPYHACLDLWACSALSAFPFFRKIYLHHSWSRSEIRQTIACMGNKIT